jgi:hypothetical protein
VDGRRLTRIFDRAVTAMLRSAGCVCTRPLLGERPGVGPRCRLCNTQAVAATTVTALTRYGAEVTANLAILEALLAFRGWAMPEVVP